MVVRKPTYKKWWLDFQGVYIYNIYIKCSLFCLLHIAAPFLQGPVPVVEVAYASNRQAVGAGYGNLLSPSNANDVRWMPPPEPEVLKGLP